MDLSTTGAFVLASLAILLIPGPSVVYVVTRSVEHGRIGGLYSVLGIETGAVIHVLAAALGLATLLESSPTAYTVIRWVGAGYLVWLAIHQFLHTAPQPDAVGGAGHRSPARLYRDGILVDLLNPKTALFFLAFLPQFVEPSQGGTAVQIGQLGLLFVVLALLCDGGYALAAGAVSGRLRSSPGWQRSTSRVTGGVYLVLAGVAVLS